MLARIALRNLARNRRRTLLALLVVAAGAAALLLTTGFVRESFTGLREAFIHGGLGHLEVAPVAALEPADRAGPPAFEDWREARRAIEAVPHVTGATGAIVLQGLVSKGDRSVPFVGAGLEPDREARMGLAVRLRSGRGLSLAAPLEGEEEALLGLTLARSLGAAEGDVVTLTSQTADGLLNALDVRVVGLVTTGVQDLDARFLQVHLVTAQRLLGTEAASSIVVMLDDSSRTTAVGEEIARRLSGHVPRLAVSDWRARAPFYGQVRSLYVAIFGFLGTIVLVLVALSSSNTLLMTVMERVREIGALRAIGTSGGQVVRMILWEAAWLGLLGGAAGCVLGSAAVAVIHALRIELPPPPGAVDPMALRLSILPWDFAWVTAVMGLLLSAAAVFPAARALRLRIAEALAHV
jgi:putative ABC transport system permease protein